MRLGRGRALVVEDEYISAAFLRRAAEKAGFAETTWARSGLEALEAAADGNFDVVFMDVKLPGRMDGIEAARAIRGRSPVFIVFVSGYQDEDLKEEALAIEATAYLEKPLLPEALGRLLEQLEGGGE